MTQKLLLLHLSDIHIKTASDAILARAGKIASATFQFLPEVHTVALVVSGDIAFSGTARQYGLAIIFIDQIKEAIRKEASRVRIEVLVCPGNHDCDFSLHDDTRDAVLAKIRTLEGVDPSASLIKTASSVEDAFFSFRNHVSDYMWSPDDRLSWALLHNPVEAEFPLTPDGVTPQPASPGCPGG
jgi:Calcineurin-like phosphoesterase